MNCIKVFHKFKLPRDVYIILRDGNEDLYDTILHKNKVECYIVKAIEMDQVSFIKYLIENKKENKLHTLFDISLHYEAARCLNYLLTIITMEEIVESEIIDKCRSIPNLSNDVLYLFSKLFNEYVIYNSYGFYNNVYEFLLRCCISNTKIITSTEEEYTLKHKSIFLSLRNMIIKDKLNLSTVFYKVVIKYGLHNFLDKCINVYDSLQYCIEYNNMKCFKKVFSLCKDKDDLQRVLHLCFEYNNFNILNFCLTNYPLETINKSELQEMTIKYCNIDCKMLKYIWKTFDLHLTKKVILLSLNENHTTIMNIFLNDQYFAHYKPHTLINEKMLIRLIKLNNYETEPFIKQSLDYLQLSKESISTIALFCLQIPNITLFTFIVEKYNVYNHVIYEMLEMYYIGRGMRPCQKLRPLFLQNEVWWTNYLIFGDKSIYTFHELIFRYYNRLLHEIQTFFEKTRIPKDVINIIESYI